MFQISFQNLLEPVELPLIKQKKLVLHILRLDKIHPLVQGNKFFKLKYNIEKALHEKKTYLITKGGAYSNHILATAAAGKYFNLKTIGIIRGEAPANFGYTLREAQKLGMELVFVSRTDFRAINETTYFNFLEQNKDEFPREKGYYIPEGGTNVFAVKGACEIMHQIPKDSDVIFTACGTGGTLAGLVAENLTAKIIGIPVLKHDGLRAEITDLLKEYNPENAVFNFELNYDYTFGGYAKFSEELIQFINSFYLETNIPLDPVYTGKMMYGILDLIKKDYFPEGSKIIALHTGGLQGIYGYNEQNYTYPIFNLLS